jgi:hypothetical protein
MKLPFVKDRVDVGFNKMAMPVSAGVPSDSYTRPSRWRAVGVLATTSMTQVSPKLFSNVRLVPAVWGRTAGADNSRSENTKEFNREYQAIGYLSVCC